MLQCTTPHPPRGGTQKKKKNKRKGKSDKCTAHFGICVNSFLNMSENDAIAISVEYTYTVYYKLYCRKKAQQYVLLHTCLSVVSLVWIAGALSLSVRPINIIQYGTSSSAWMTSWRNGTMVFWEQVSIFQLLQVASCWKAKSAG